jgi:hypothetical protein
MRRFAVLGFAILVVALDLGCTHASYPVVLSVDGKVYQCTVTEYAMGWKATEMTCASK